MSDTTKPQVVPTLADEELEKLKNHPLFAKSVADMEGTPEFEALQAIKYESEDPNANATAYKEEGNHYMSQKDFAKAVSAYSGGILAKPTDVNLLAVLYTNRGIASGMMRNHGSCVKDCRQAIKYMPSHMKAYVQSSKSLIILQKYSEAVEMCESGLLIDPEQATLIELKKKAGDLEKAVAKKKSERLDGVRQDCERLMHVIKQLISRGIQVNLDLPPIGLPESAGVAISFDRVNKIHWPLLFTYPEFNQTDFIQDAGEFLTIEHCLKQVLNPADPPSWDTNKAYTTSLESIEVFYEDVSVKKQMVPVPLSMTLTELSKTPGFFVRRDLVIVLLIVSKLSVHFHKAWMANLLE